MMQRGVAMFTISTDLSSLLTQSMPALRHDHSISRARVEEQTFLLGNPA
jgi:hypothetical protein